MNSSDTGILLNKNNITLQRKYFEQFVKLKGINVKFRALREAMKNYNEHGELDARYYPPVIVGCIYDEHPNQRTMKKLGWNSQLADTPIIIHVPYDLQGCEVGGLFSVPSGLDNAGDREFRIVKMSNIAIYPASIACEIAPNWKNNTEASEVVDFKSSNFNLLVDPEAEE